MSDETTSAPDNAQPEPRWKPIGAVERRILGVLAEKAKTTPDQYPISLNALTTGCNQKSNRSPQMELEASRLEEALENLRELGAVGEVLGSGRVARYRHYLYEWMGVDKVELAVMAELLLRGAQTIGELRGRAGRMEPIADVSSLRPLLNSLMQKKLVVSLTTEGRGQVVTHALYLDHEMEKVKREHGAGGETIAQPSTRAAGHPAPAVAPRPQQAAVDTGMPSSEGAVEQLRREVSTLREEVALLKREVEDIWSNLR
jgi:uncharacterized protein YceH (UPF0502 family)